MVFQQESYDVYIVQFFFDSVIDFFPFTDLKINNTGSGVMGAPFDKVIGLSHGVIIIVIITNSLRIIIIIIIINDHSLICTRNER